MWWAGAVPGTLRSLTCLAVRTAPWGATGATAHPRFLREETEALSGGRQSDANPALALTSRLSPATPWAQVRSQCRKGEVAPGPCGFCPVSGQWPRWILLEPKASLSSFLPRCRFRHGVRQPLSPLAWATSGGNIW